MANPKPNNPLYNPNREPTKQTDAEAFEEFNKRIAAAFQSASTATNQALASNATRVKAQESSITPELIKKLKDYETSVLKSYEKQGTEEFLIPQIKALFQGIMVKDLYAHIDQNPIATWSELVKINAVSGSYLDYLAGRNTAGTEFSNPVSQLVTGVTGAVDNLGDAAKNLAQDAKKVTGIVKDLTDPDALSIPLVIGGVGAGLLVIYLITRN